MEKVTTGRVSTYIDSKIVVFFVVVLNTVWRSVSPKRAAPEIKMQMVTKTYEFLSCLLLN